MNRAGGVRRMWWCRTTHARQSSPRRRVEGQVRVHCMGTDPWLEGAGGRGTTRGWVHAGHTGLLDVAFQAGVSIPACERVAAAVACAKVEPVQRLARGSGARASVRQRAAVECAVPRIVPRHAEGVPDARGRQGCAQVPAAADRAERLGLEIPSWPFPRFVKAATHAHKFVLDELRRGRGYRGGGLWDPDRPIKRSVSNPTYMYALRCRP